MDLGNSDPPKTHAYYDADNGDLKVAPGEREPREVLGSGLIGSIDSYTVSHPCVIFENGTFRMWYTANDSNNRRIAYAASTDGVTWVRGGLMIDLGNTANDDFGAWAPTVWKEGAAYLMVYTGWKPISGGTVVQSKLIEATSDNGTTWDTGAVTLNPGNRDDFDGYNLFLPFVLVDGPAPQYPKKMWYALYLLFACVGGAMAATFTAIGAVLSESVATRVRGLAMGGYNTCIYGGFMVSAASLGVVIERWGYAAGFGVAGVACILPIAAAAGLLSRGRLS